ncbi:MAG: hypothetical protein ACRC1W_05135 [Shewanella sp.]
MKKIHVTVKRPNILWRIFMRLWGVITVSGYLVGFTTYWGTVLIRDERWHDKRLLAHELTHVEQIHQLGVLRFTWRYVKEFLKRGYRGNTFEVEARENAMYRTMETINRFNIKFK